MSGRNQCNGSMPRDGDVFPSWMPRPDPAEATVDDPLVPWSFLAARPSNPLLFGGGPWTLALIPILIFAGPGSIGAGTVALLRCCAARRRGVVASCAGRGEMRCGGWKLEAGGTTTCCAGLGGTVQMRLRRRALLKFDSCCL